MTISVLTPDRTIFLGDISAVTLPGVLGEFQIKDRHAALVSSLTAGTVSLETSGEYSFYDEQKKATTETQNNQRRLSFSIDRGFVEVLNNEVNLLVQGARNLR